MRERCPQFCKPCFDEEHPVSCAADLQQTSSESLELVLDTCFDLLFYVGGIPFDQNDHTAALVYAAGLDHAKQQYGFTFLVAFVSPLSAFNNFLVYIRPKIRVPRSQKLLSSLFRFSNRQIIQRESAGDSNNKSSEQHPVVERKVDPSVAIASHNQAVPCDIDEDFA